MVQSCRISGKYGIFFREAGINNAATNSFQANLTGLQQITYAHLNQNARDFLGLLISYMKESAGWSTSRLITPTNSPNNRPGPGGNRGGGAGGPGIVGVEE